MKIWTAATLVLAVLHVLSAQALPQHAYADDNSTDSYADDADDDGYASDDVAKEATSLSASTGGEATLSPTPTPPSTLASDAEDSYDEPRDGANAYDDDDESDDDDDDPAPAPVQSEQRSMGGQSPKQNDGGGRPGTDKEPNVHNGGKNLYPYTQEIREYIVDQHNLARATMAPSEAANMRQLQWNEALAIEASELVNTCVFEHDTEDYAYGQNLMYGNQQIDKPTVASWMKAWVQDEISQYDRRGDGFMDLDHASAVLWAQSYYVGCASKLCDKGYLTACNYFTQGNWQGEPAYRPGKPCSQCPTQAPYCDATHGKLCTANKSPPTPAPAPTPAATLPKPPPKPAATLPKPAPTPAKTAGKPAHKPTPAPSKPGKKKASSHKLCV